MSRASTGGSMFIGARSVDADFENTGIIIVSANKKMSEASQAYSAKHSMGIIVVDYSKNTND